MMRSRLRSASARRAGSGGWPGVSDDVMRTTVQVGRPSRLRGTVVTGIGKAVPVTVKVVIVRAAILDSVPAGPAVSEVEKPRPEAGELLVRVAAASVNGFDAATAAGYLQGMMEHRFPLVPGKDFAGTVEALGEGAEGFAVGDAVFGVVMKLFLGTGSLAEYVTVPAAYGVAHIPPALSVREAGALGLAGTAALDALNAVDRDKGDTVL